jgi:tetratricopeptide (TPR) repeat protein
VAALALVVKIIPLDISVTAADRFLYVPLAGLAIAAAVGGSRLALPRGKVALAAASAALVVLGVATFRRTAAFEDDVGFWVTEARRAPIGSIVPGLEIGNALSRDGRYEDALGFYQRVLSDLRTANSYPPQIVRDVRRNLAVALARIGRVDDAIAILDLLVAKAPDDPVLLRNRTTLLLMRRRWEAAEKDLSTLDRVAPGDATALAIRKVLNDLRREWEDLEARRAISGDSAALLVARARILARMDAQAEAGSLYEAVTSRPDAGTSELREATLWLVKRGKLAAAASSVDRYASTGAADAMSLREILTLRMERQRKVDAALARLRG